MKKYVKYKDSGVEWIGAVPYDWSFAKLKYLVDYKNGNAFKSEDFSKDEKVPVVRIGEVGDIINFDDCVKLPLSFLDPFSEFIIKKNDILVGLTGATIGKSGRYNYENQALLNQRVCRLRNNRLTLNGFLYYFVKSELFTQNILFNCYGGGQDNIGKDEILNMICPLPSLIEQNLIVNSLDEKTSFLDDLIQKKLRKIELLKEQRTSIINHIVTKGLYHNVESKDSKEKWLGDIPKHWNVIRLRYLGDLQNGISKDAEYFGFGFPFLNYGDVYNNDVLPMEVKGLVNSSESDRQKYSVTAGDIFFTRTSETIDDIGISSVCMKTIPDCVFSGFVIRFRKKTDGFTTGFSKYYLKSNFCKVFIENSMNLVTRASLSQDILKSLPILLPPIEEQHQIVEYLDKKTSEIDKQVDLEHRKIDLLKEYRQSLISEVVTGKIDVRTN